METRDIVLACLILVVGLAIFYLLDPTLGGLMKTRMEGFNNFTESFANELQGAELDAPGVSSPTMHHAAGAQETFENLAHADTSYQAVPTPNAPPSAPAGQQSTVEAFETLTPAPMPFKDAQKPANCYPKDQIAPQELLPNDPNSKWAQVNPQGQGDIAGKNYLSAGALIGVNTIGQSLRNANYQLRSDPPNPQVKVSIWNQTTIEPDVNRRALEIA